MRNFGKGISDFELRISDFPDLHSKPFRRDKKFAIRNSKSEIPLAYWFAALRAWIGVRVISVLRLRERPATVVFFARGFDAPMPLA